jgi:diacylglycerol kinase (ATP)
MSEPRARAARPSLLGVGCAVRGIWLVLGRHRNGRIHVALAAAALAVGGVLGLDAVEWCLVAGSIAAVTAAEVFNTSIEQLADALCPEHHPGIGRAKDMAAGAVLLAAAGAACIGAVVFGGRLLQT